MLQKPLWKSDPEELNGPTLIQGPAGCGKTRFIIDEAARYLKAGHDPEALLVLAPTRVAADRLKSGINAVSGATISTVPVRTWSSYAFHLIARAFEAGLTHYENVDPALLTGADQDAILKDLIAGAQLDWPADLGFAPSTAGFRKEVREFFDRMQEYGLDQQGLEELCQRTDATPEVWPLLGQLFTDYTQVMQLNEAGRFDPASLISTAVTIMRAGAEEAGADLPNSSGFGEFFRKERERLKLVLIDDLQEANPAMHQLLNVLGAGKPLVAVGCADTVVQGFRGARPELLNASAGTISWDQKIHVNHSHTLHGDLARAYQRVTTSIGATGDAVLARLEGAPDNDQHARTETEVALTGSVAEQDLLVLSYVLNWLKGDANQGIAPVPLSQQAIIVRNGAQVSSFAKFLRTEGVPVRTTVSDMVLAEEPAVAALLNLLQISIELAAEDEPELSVRTLEAALRGTYIGMTNLQLRALRKQVIRRPVTAGTEETGDELIDAPAMEALRWTGTARERLATLATMALRRELDPLQSPDLPAHLREPYQQWSSFAPLRKLITVLARTIRSLQDPAQFAEDTLWELWSATGVAEQWKERSAHPGAEGLHANHDLDAVVTLFQVAKRFQDQNLAATATQFVQHIQALDLPTDSLSRAGQNSDAIAILTPAAAAGLHFSHVIVAGLQQGRWPNEQPRGTLLGSTELVEVLENQPHIGQEAQLARRQSIRNDELRSFATAISRARNKLVAIAIADNDQQPSTFLQYIPNEGTEFTAEHTPLTDVPVPPTPQQIVGELRRNLRTLVTGPNSADPAIADEVAGILGFLARQTHAELEAARPEHWWGVAERSSTQPLFQAGEDMRLSPSKVESLVANPVSWLFDQMGDDSAPGESDLYRHVGTMIHYLAETHPSGSLEELESAATKLLTNLNLHGYFGQQMGKRITGMIAALANYYRHVLIHKTEVLAVEARFLHEHQTESNTVFLSGVIDRIEKTEAGKIRIIDFKTGSRVPSKKDVAAHIQLALYQLAYNAGAVELEELTDIAVDQLPQIEQASLVQLGAENNVKIPSFTRDQPPLAEADIDPVPLLELCSALLQQSYFAAISSAETFGGTKDITPENPSGTQVTE
ncbi:UvrD-helicase domain-containing protein [Micrococcoides hystricis]|uniref:DNA 3'-5' helicase n=1 Tax=Micrococcoides hystricis TaxID=1572761 RepID=A0ABV6P8A2_9MICC